MRNYIRITVAVVLCVIMVLQFSSCGMQEHVPLDVQEVSADKIDIVTGDKYDEIVTDFSMSLFSESISEDENSMISPVSILAMLAMIENGAAGDTLKQLEETTDMSTEELTGWLMGFRQRIDMACSIWFKDCDEFKLRDEYIAEMREYFDSDVFRAPFDSSTTDAIDEWVNDATDGMIKKMNKKFKVNDKIVLLNAVTFEKEWEKKYEAYQISENEDFYCRNGSVKKVTMLYSEENRYIEDDVVCGFIKPYKDGCSFVALCPKPDGIIKCGTQIMTDCAEHLTGDVFRNLIENARYEKVNAAMPEFRYEYSFGRLEEVLKQMGIVDMFDYSADLTDMENGETDIFIDEVAHKTFIEVDRAGTKAAAASLAVGADKAAPVEKVKEVRLDRPFIYAIIDDETGVPLFTGAVVEM